MEQHQGRRSNDLEQAVPSNLPERRNQTLIQSLNSNLGDDGARVLGDWSLREENRLTSLKVGRNALKISKVQHH